MWMVSDTYEEPPITIMWVVFPFFCVYFINQLILYSLGLILDKLIQVDVVTARLSCLYVACVLVKIDISTPLAREIWIGTHTYDDCQKVKFKGFPSYCQSSKIFGHEYSACFKVHPGSWKSPYNDPIVNDCFINQVVARKTFVWLKHRSSWSFHLARSCLLKHAPYEFFSCSDSFSYWVGPFLWCCWFVGC